MGLLPTLRYKRVYDIPQEKLKELDITLILLDMDNTTAPWRTDYVAPRIASWVEETKKENITVALLTNSKGTNADSIGKQLDIPVYKNAKKPFKKPTENLLKALSVKAENTLFVGDQLFTDIQLANAINAKSVLLEPIDNREWWATKVFNRTREKLVWKFLFK
jgi:HAD superfamily phosphatase (TIGR01668 family)